MEYFPEKSEPLGETLKALRHAFRDPDIIQDAEVTASRENTEELPGIAARNRWTGAGLTTMSAYMIASLLSDHMQNEPLLIKGMLAGSAFISIMMAYRLRLYSKRIQEIFEERKGQ